MRGCVAQMYTSGANERFYKKHIDDFSKVELEFTGLDAKLTEECR